MSLPQSNGKTLLITGINGYCATVLGLLLLKKGYNIRGTARRLPSTEPLLNGAYKDFKDRVEIVSVTDMTVPGAFDEAVKGVHGIFHVASPVDFSNPSYEAMIDVAVAGNITLLQSALDKAGPQLEAVVVTSSMAAVANPPLAPGSILTEKRFDTVDLEICDKDRLAGVKTPPMTLYYASKQAAEIALWKFRDTKKPTWSISAINPTVIIGPPILLPAKGSKIKWNETLQPLWEILSGEAKTMPDGVGTEAFVDVRDVADAHLWCFENPKIADGERYITAAGYGPNQAATDVIREAYPERKDIILVGNPGEGYAGYGKGYVGYLPETVQAVGEKAEKVMGLKYIDFKTSVLDTCKVFEQFL